MRALPLIASLLLLAACDDTPPKTPTTTASSAAPVSGNTGAAASSASATVSGVAAGAKTYGIVASFSAADQKARDSVGEVVTQWRIAKGFKLETKRPKWGPNGESDVCVDLSELNETDRKKVVDEMKTSVGKNDKVTLTENATCHEDKK